MCILDDRLRPSEKALGHDQRSQVLSVLFIFFFLTCAYYLLTSQVTAKASVMATTGMSFGMTVNLLQNVGIIGMMTVSWPEGLAGILSAFQVLLLDIDNYSFACFAGAP